MIDVATFLIDAPQSELLSNVSWDLVSLLVRHVEVEYPLKPASLHASLILELILYVAEKCSPKEMVMVYLQELGGVKNLDLRGGWSLGL